MYASYSPHRTSTSPSSAILCCPRPHMIQMEGSGEAVLCMFNSLTNGADGKDGVLCKTTQSLSHKGMNSIFREQQDDRWEDSLNLTPT